MEASQNSYRLKALFSKKATSEAFMQSCYDMETLGRALDIKEDNISQFVDLYIKRSFKIKEPEQPLLFVSENWEMPEGFVVTAFIYRKSQVKNNYEYRIIDLKQNFPKLLS